MLIYFFAGDKNPIDNFGRRIINLNDKLKKYRVKEVSYKLYKDGRNQMLNEKNKIEGMDDIIAWMLKKV